MMKRLIIICATLASILLTAAANASCGRQDATGLWELTVSGDATWTHCELTFRVDSTLNVDESICTEYDFEGNANVLDAFVSGTIDAVARRCSFTITLMTDEVNTLTGRISRGGEVMVGRWIAEESAGPFTAVRFR